MNDELDDVVSDDAGNEMDTDLVRQLRATIKRQGGELAQERERNRSYAFKEAGIDPAAGIGKAISQLYQGDPDPAQIQQFATEYGWTPSEDTPVLETVQAGLNAQVAQQSAAGQRASNVAAVGSPRDIGNDPLTQAQVALSEGRVDESIALKINSLMSQS